jgi:hypothetical protein
MELSKLMEIIHDSDCSLFLGAGASINGGGPTSKDLLSDVRRKFPEIGDEKDFFRAFDKIIINDDKRAEVEHFLKSIFISLVPKPENRYLISIPWRAVMTTNYDSILDFICNTMDKNRSLQIQYTSDPRIEIRRDDYLYCFKLFGDINVPYSQDGHMVLTNSDRRRAYSRQAAYLKLFRDLARTGNVVYLGYSFEDELVFDILHDLIFESRTFPHRGFAIMPNEPNEETQKKLARHNIEWVKGTLDDFVLEAKKVFGEIPKSCSVTMHPVKVHGNIIDLDVTTRWNIRGKFKIVNQGDFFSDFKDARPFFEGKDNSLVPFSKSWVFDRKWKLLFCSKASCAGHFESIENLIKMRTNLGSPTENVIYALKGSAGSGKSVMGKKIAYEWYLSGNPVILLDPNNMFIDSIAIQYLLDELWNKYRKQLDNNQVPKTIRYLIICDNCSLLLPEIAQLSDYLTSEGKPVDILLIDRSSELSDSVLTEIGAVAAFDLDDSITADERAAFVDYFKRLDILPDVSALSANLENPYINDSFFALTFTSIRESQLTLKEIIIKEYESKNAKIRRLYALTSLIQSYGLNAIQTIMTKSSDLLLFDVLANIKSGSLRDVLVLNEEEQSFAAMHRIIAEIIRNHVFSTYNELRNGLSQIISMTTNGNIAEMRLVHKLLIECPEVQRTLPLPILEDLYKQATKIMSTRPLFIQLANIQLKTGEYKDCRESINNAAKFEHPIFTEPKLHVFDVEGRLNLALAREMIEKNDSSEDPTIQEKIWEQIEKAHVSFSQAKINPLITPHPYLGLAQSYELMEELEQVREIRFDYCILALGIINQLKSDAPTWFDPTKYLTIEQNAISKLTKANFNETDAIALFNRTHNANGYAFLADNESKIGHNLSALPLVNKGLALDGKSLWLTKSKVSIIKALYPFDYDRIYDVITQFTNQIQNFFDLDLTFELAKAQFIKGDWSTAMKTFYALSHESKGSRSRFLSSTQDRWMEKGGLNPKILTGSIAKMPTITEKGEIICIEPIIPFPIPLRHFNLIYLKQNTSLNRDSEKVTFEILFNMRGPEASNVKQR